MSDYTRLNRAPNSSEDFLHGEPTAYSNTASQVPHSNMKHGPTSYQHPVVSSEDGSYHDDPTQQRPGLADTRKKSGSTFSIPKIYGDPWQHRLSEKHLRKAPSTSDTLRYFDRRRQTRRVFIDCLIMWSGTLIICLGLFGTLYGFSTIRTGLNQTQKLAYNAIITGLSITLGLAFAAQFKQYAEMMRWRFLSSQYRSIEEFEDILGCDSYRSTMKIMFSHKRLGQWYPSKAQVIAGAWLLVFIMFNVFTALLGLTASLDISENFVHIDYGNVSVLDLKYIAGSWQPDHGADYEYTNQKAAANVWGQLGRSFDWYNRTIDQVESYTGGSVFTTMNHTYWWNRFVDLSPKTGKTQANIVTTRFVSSSATCRELKVTYGGYAGFNTDDASLVDLVSYIDGNGNEVSDIMTQQVTGRTTWMGNNGVDCGKRCAQVLALQVANNYTLEEASASDPPFKGVPKPRLWECNNTMSQVGNYDAWWEGFETPDDLKMPDDQAYALAGAIGWTGVSTTNTNLEYVNYSPDTIYSPAGNSTAHEMATLLMKFTVGTLNAMDIYNAPRRLAVGTNSPSPAQIVNVKWPYAGAILAGVPALQFFMLLGVVWFSGKAVILEPSYFVAGNLLHKVLEKISKAGSGSLLSSDEMAEKLGEDYKICYGVRPHEGSPEDDTIVRDLDVIEEGEGYGKLTRGKMPTGRYE